MKHTLQVTLTRRYGTVDLNLTLTAERLLDSEKGLPEYDNLMSQAELYFEHFVEHWLPRVGKPAEFNAMQTKTVDALEIRVTMSKGKKYFKVAVPAYEEHGIPFWPEHMIACGIDPKEVPMDGHKCKEGTKALLEMVDGKPKRVLKLIRE